MKSYKAVSALLVFALALSLCACGSANAPAAASEPAAAEEPHAAAEVPAPAEESPKEEAAAGTETPSEPVPAYDAAAYEAAAQALRDEYIRIVQAGIEGLENYDEDAHPEIPWYTAVMTRYIDQGIYEAFRDFDGNGVPEMMISTYTDDTMGIIGVYAFDGSSMRYLCKEHPLGERSHLSRADGLFVVHGSGGAASGILAVYRIAEDGWSTDLIDVIDYLYSDAEHVTYTSEMGNITPEEVESRGLADLYSFDFVPEWACFYKAG